MSQLSVVVMLILRKIIPLIKMCKGNSVVLDILAIVTSPIQSHAIRTDDFR